MQVIFFVEDCHGQTFRRTNEVEQVPENGTLCSLTSEEPNISSRISFSRYRIAENKYYVYLEELDFSPHDEVALAFNAKMVEDVLTSSGWTRIRRENIRQTNFLDS